MEILQNPWIIGIFSGIVSGIVILIIGRLISSKREKKVYNQKVLQGNQELITPMKPLILENNKSIGDLYSSMKSAVSKKYNINIDDLYSINDFADIIIAETLQSPFLNDEQKKNHCKEILDVKNESTCDKH